MRALLTAILELAGFVLVPGGWQAITRSQMEWNLNLCPLVYFSFKFAISEDKLQP